MCTDDFADCVIHRLFAGDPRSSTGGHHSDHPGNSREKGPWYVVGTQFREDLERCLCIVETRP